MFKSTIISFCFCILLVYNNTYAQEKLADYLGLPDNDVKSIRDEESHYIGEKKVITIHRSSLMKRSGQRLM